MALYTLQEIRNVARSKDIRLEDKKKYPDTWIDNKIEHAFETAESGRQVFSNEEVIDLKQYVLDGVAELDLDMDEEVHELYAIIPNHEFEITGKVNNDNSISVSLDVDKLVDKKEDINLTVRYFYYPRLGFDSIFMKPEVYHYFRHCLYVNLYGSLRDKENEMYHQEQVDRFIADGSFGIPNDLSFDIPMKGSFDIRPKAI